MKINKNDLQVALERVRPGLATRELIDQATSFAFFGDRVVTYNDEISISHPVKKLNLEGAVKAQALYDFLGRVKKDEIDLEQEQNQIIIKAGRCRAGLIFEQEVRLPLDEELSKINSIKWKELPDDFLEALKFCHPCCSADMSRPELTCLYIQGNQVEASDSYRIVRYNLKSFMPVDSFLIPATAVRNLIKYDVKEIAKGQSWVHFRTADGTIFSSRIYLGEYVNTAPYLEIEGFEFIFPKEIMEVLERAHVFSKTEIKNVISEAVIEIGKNRIKVSSKNESGWFEEAVRNIYDGEPIKFTVGVDFLRDLFSKVRNCLISQNKICFQGTNWVHVVATFVVEAE